MGWKVKLASSALKSLKKLDKGKAERIMSFLGNLERMENPRVKGKPLKGTLGEFWVYRVGKYRLICSLLDDDLVVLVVKVGHRKEVYRGN